MTKGKREKPVGSSGRTADVQPGASPGDKPSTNIFTRQNRGWLLDIFVFLLNLFLMRMLTTRFIALAADAGRGDSIAGFVMLLFCVGIFVLPAAGATLKRWHVQQRLQAKGEAKSDINFAFGCLFNPVIYFSLNIIIYVLISVYAMQLVYGDEPVPNGIQGASTVFGMALTIVQTFLIYRYFSPPKKEPGLAFLKSPGSEFLGDVCLYLYMICFQIIWNWLIPQFGWKITGFMDFIYKLIFLFLLALLVYFPPRIFYLAEDIYRRRTWLMILLAQSPVIARMFLG